MSFPEERPDWKDIYKGQWKPGSNREKYVRELIQNEFPDLECALGYGAEKDERIPYDPKHEKGAPDQFWYHEGKLLVQLEVTGTDKVVKDYVMIRPDKLYHALTDRTKGITTWFWGVFINTDYILATELVEKYKDSLWTHRLYGRAEKYIHVPCNEALSKTHLFDWIREQQQAIVIRVKNLSFFMKNRGEK